MASNHPHHGEKELTISFLEMKLNKIIVVVGTTGTGKSTIINMLHNNDFNKKSCENPCPIGSTADSVTKEPHWYFHDACGKVYCDTVGLSDPNLSAFEVAKMLKKFIEVFRNGVHCIIIVAKFGRFTREERANLKVISKIFDSRWVMSCILVLTHYDGETDNEAEQKAIKDWLATDKELNDFCSKIGNRILLTDNSLGRSEVSNRPVRERFLKKLNEFVDSCTILVGRNPKKDFFDKLEHILEPYFSLSRVADAQQRAKDVIKFLLSSHEKAGTCPICLEVMELSNMAQTNCRHTFHMNCIYNFFPKKVGNCPVCRQNVHKIVHLGEKTKIEDKH